MLSLHKVASDNKTRLNLEKSIYFIIKKDTKSLIYDISALQQSTPFMISAFIREYFMTLSQVIVDPGNLVKNTTLKYTLLAMRKFIREFSFYS